MTLRATTVVFSYGSSTLSHLCVKQFGDYPTLLLGRLSLDFCYFLKYFFCFMCVNVCLYVYMFTICMQCPLRAEVGISSPGAGITEGCELSII